MVEKWKAESIQAVVFTSNFGQGTDAFQIWTRIFSSSPDGFQKRPDGPSVAHGKVDGANYQIGCAPGRVDAFLHGDLDENGLPNLPRFDEALSNLGELAKQIAAFSEPKRLALVANLFYECSNQREAVEKFTKILPVSDLPLASMDVSFTLNLRKKILEGRAEINRLARWMTGQRQLIQFQVGLPNLHQDAIVAEQSAMLLVLDLNTSSVAHLPIEPGDASDIFDALMQECKELKEGGYAALIENAAP